MGCKVYALYATNQGENKKGERNIRLLKKKKKAEKKKKKNILGKQDLKQQQNRNTRKINKGEKMKGASRKERNEQKASPKTASEVDGYDARGLPSLTRIPFGGEGGGANS